MCVYEFLPHKEDRSDVEGVCNQLVDDLHTPATRVQSQQLVLRKARSSVLEKHTHHEHDRDISPTSDWHCAIHVLQEQRAGLRTSTMTVLQALRESIGLNFSINTLVTRAEGGVSRQVQHCTGCKQGNSDQTMH